MNRCRYRFSSCCLLLCLLLRVSVCSAQSQEPLRWKFNQGDIHNYRLVQNNSMTMNLGSIGDVKTDFVQTVDMVWEVEEVAEDGTARISQKIERIRLKMTAPGQAEISYDTDSEERPVGYAAMLVPIFKSLTKAPFVVSMKPRGEIIEFEVPQEVKDSMKNLPGAKMMGDFTTEKGLKNAIQQLALVLPKPEDMNEGYQWTASSTMSNPILGDVVSKMNFTYKGAREVEGQLLEVFEPTLEMSFESPDSSQEFLAGIEDQSSSGEILFNRTLGRLESSNLNQEMVMQFNIGERVADQKIDQKIELTHLDKFD